MPMITELENKGRKKYSENVTIDLHPEIRSREACIKSSDLAVSLSKKYNSRLHVL
ncbi:dihydroorotase, partial [Francisella tularensis]|nr:dihydroorotase [Francisella tularensis]